MTKTNVLQRLKDMGLRGDTISFYVDKDGNEQSDVSFGDCEISGIVGNLVDCTALGEDGKVYSFQAGEWLVSGHLGKIAGAF